MPHRDANHLNDIKKWTPTDVEQHIADPLEALGVTCLLEPMATLSEQIKILEKEALKRGNITRRVRWS